METLADYGVINYFNAGVLSQEIRGVAACIIKSDPVIHELTLKPIHLQPEGFIWTYLDSSISCLPL